MTDLTILADQAADIIAKATSAGVKIATAESCTGGLIVGVLTEIAGSSAVVDRGFVTYSNEAKTGMLDVPADLIESQGAVSAPVAIAMVDGALAHSNADIAVAVTGVAGPGGGSEAKPVGLVHLGVKKRGQNAEHVEHRFGDIGRAEVRIATIREALAMIQRLI